MKTKTTIAALFMLASVQACSQGTFSTRHYPFPIPIEPPPTVTMQEQAEQQAEERKSMMGDPYKGQPVLVVDLSSIPDSAWCYPLPRARVISPYGHGRTTHRHSGIDLKTHANDTIRAALDGIVTMSQPFAAYGNCIVLRHLNGLETLYSHNSKNLVVVGQLVNAGQPIALTGRTGRATTEHLHFEVRVAGKHYNPNILFDHHTKKLKHNKLTFTKGGGMKTD
jgi:murein DD-endopeptidase MepM/ murein hydrolase activator NlpD